VGSTVKMPGAPCPRGLEPDLPRRAPSSSILKIVRFVGPAVGGIQEFPRRQHLHLGRRVDALKIGGNVENVCRVSAAAAVGVVLENHQVAAHFADDVGEFPVG